MMDLIYKMIVPLLTYYCFKEKHFSGNSKDYIFDLNVLAEDLHMKYMQITLVIISKSCNLAVRSELSRNSLHMNIFTAVLKYWARRSRMQKDPILVDVFHLAVDMAHGNKLTSSLYILKLLKELKQSFYCFNRLPRKNKS